MLLVWGGALYAQTSTRNAPKTTSQNKAAPASGKKKSLKEKDREAADKINETVEKTQDKVRQAGESVKKVTHKNTAFWRFWHNYTGYFNVYFNAKDSYDEGMKLVTAQYPYDYSDILPVFPFTADTIPGLVTAEMVRTMEKSNKTVRVHSITGKPKVKKNKKMTPKEQAFYNKHEYCIWVGDAIFLIGLANIYLHEYTLARLAFEHVIVEYPENDLLYPARIWTAVVDGATDRGSQQETMLQMVAADRKFPKKYATLRNEAMADMMIRKKDYSQAIRYLEAAVKKRWKPSVVNRYHYILGQLYQNLNSYTLAAEHYKKAKRFAGEDMRINAQINYAYLSAGRSDNMRKTLLKMAKKHRNERYYDQIYYALAELEMQTHREEQAIEYYLKALSYNDMQRNKRLRITTSHKLAVYFEQKSDFENAQAYYDTTAMLMPITEPAYNTVYNKAKNLNKLAVNLRIIRTQDSLQRIAKMSEKDRNAWVAKMITQYQADSTRRAERAAAEIAAAASGGGSTSTMGGKWYFHNATLLNTGKQEFQKVWGERKLADNWRIFVVEDNFDNSTNEIANPTIANDTAKQKESAAGVDAAYFLREVPLTQEQMNASNANIATAMLEAAKAYRDYINDNKSAIKMLENLLKRYPETEHKMAAYFYLYTLYNQEKNTKQAKVYRQKLEDEFPNEELTKYVIDPAYVSESEWTQKQADSLFAKAFGHYSNSEYAQAERTAREGMNLYKTLPIGANFALLQAMAKGNSTNLAAHIYNLQTVISTYPASEVAETAKKMIEIIQKDDLVLSQQTAQRDADIEEQTPAVPYTNDDDNTFFAVAFDPREINIHQLRFNIVSHNVDIDADDLTIDMVKLTAGTNLMLVGNFNHWADGVKYFQSITAAATLYKDMQTSSLITFAITQKNLELLQADRMVTTYLQFFNQPSNRK
ncbi:gliding motility protein [Bacteroidia bacterium]|nr:gliding motility protein [Bacteroidia bacterium]